MGPDESQRVCESKRVGVKERRVATVTNKATGQWRRSSTGIAVVASAVDGGNPKRDLGFGIWDLRFRISGAEMKDLNRSD